MIVHSIFTLQSNPFLSEKKKEKYDFYFKLMTPIKVYHF